MLTPMLAAATLAVAWAPPPALWTTVPPMFYSEIVQQSDVIVTGTVLSRDVRYERGRQTIRTYVTLGNMTFHKGQARETLTLRFEGGKIGDDTLVVPGMPDLQTGRRYLLYVNGTRLPDNVSPIVGFHQGAFEVTDRGGREVLVAMDGNELVGIQHDRFVFAKKSTPGIASTPSAPAIGEENHEYKPADPNADAIEARMIAEQMRKAQRELRPRPLAELPGGANVAAGDAPPATSAFASEDRDRALAMPVVLDASADPGVRVDVSDMLRSANIERR